MSYAIHLIALVVAQVVPPAYRITEPTAEVVQAVGENTSKPAPSPEVTNRNDGPTLGNNSASDIDQACLNELNQLSDECRKKLSKSISKEFDRLESRIEELEDQLATGHAKRHQVHAIPPTLVPSPYAQPIYQNPIPQKPAPESVPKSWQRFNFNGQWFYIVPVGEVPTPAGPTAE